MDARIKESTKETRTLLLSWLDVAGLFSQCGTSVPTGSVIRVGWAEHDEDDLGPVPDGFTSMTHGRIAFTVELHRSGEEWLEETAEAR